MKTEIKKWRNEFRSHILERGLDYYESGMVTDLEETENGYKAVVSGSEDYSVEIVIENGKVLSMFCDCPYAEDGNNCKHMAAVLYEIEDGEIERKPPKILFEKIDESRVKLQQVVDKIPINELKKLVVELAWDDTSLQSKLMLQYAEKMDEHYILQLKKEVDRISYENSDRGGFVDYYHAPNYVDEMQSFLCEKVQKLIDKNYYMYAFELTNYVFYCISSQEMDDSDGGVSWLANECYDLWKQVLEKCNDDEKKQMFQWFREHQHGYVIDYMENYIVDFMMEEFHDEELLRQKLVDLDIWIQNASEEAESGMHYMVRYGFVNNILKRIQMMKELGATEQEVLDYRKKYRNFSEIRKLEIQECLEKKSYDEAIGILLESKRLDEKQQGLLAEYSQKLIEIYKLLGKEKEYKEELVQYIFICPQYDLEYINELKDICEVEEWQEYTEKILKSKTTYSIRYVFMESEQLYEQLLQELIYNRSIHHLDNFEKVLKKVYPERVRDAYISMVKEQANTACDRSRYKELAKYLKKISKYPEGKKYADEIAAEWKVLYRRRPAMMDELRKARF